MAAGGAVRAADAALVDTVAEIDTPERVRFRYRLAGPGSRGVAYVLDLLIQGTVMAVAVALNAAFALFGEVAAGAGVGLFLLVLFLLAWIYGAFFEWLWAGQTPGKWATGLRVVRSDGAPIGWSDALLRNLARGVDALPFLYVVGGIATVMDPRMRRLGDLLAGTMVVVEQGTSLGDAVEVDPPVTEAERQALPVRVTLTPDERRAIEGLLSRRPQLGEARVEELAAMLAPTLAARTGVEAPTALRTLVLAWARATGRDR